MSCYSCGSTFGLFKKELGCKNCGYAFCKDCLTKKAAIPKLKNEKHKVCLKCYNLLTGQTPPENKNVTYSPPAALKKRLAKLDQNLQSPEHYVAKVASERSKAINTKGMSKEDVAIAIRLQKLKESRKQNEPAVPSEIEMRDRLDKLKKDAKVVAPPSEQEMMERLAKLKGQNVDSINKLHVFKTEHRPEAQQVEDLLQEICDEVEIDSHHINYNEDAENHVSLQHTYAELQNNLNTPDTKHQAHYTKNIPHVDSDYVSSSGENVDWSEMNHLIRQVANELQVDAAKAVQGLKQDEELWNRLAKIRQNKETKIENSDESAVSGIQKSLWEEEKEEEEACKVIIRELLEESRLEDELEEAEVTGKLASRLPSVPSERHTSQQRSSPDDQSESDELPYCCLCNDDAVLRCINCSGDLYCKSCFREVHKRENHMTKPFHPPNK